MMELFWIGLWWVVGVAAFVYWWTQDCDLGWSEAILACFAGLMGPIAILFGYMLHGKSSTPIIKRRQ
jgi:hypothetical protein